MTNGFEEVFAGNHRVFADKEEFIEFCQNHLPPYSGLTALCLDGGFMTSWNGNYTQGVFAYLIAAMELYRYYVRAEADDDLTDELDSAFELIEEIANRGLIQAEVELNELIGDCPTTH